MRRSNQRRDDVGLRQNLWVELAREVLRHSHASRTRLELLLVKHAVYLTGLVTRRGGAGPVMTGGGRSAPAADRRGSRLYIHPTAKELQIHVHLAGGRLHHVVAGAHDASVWLGDRGLSVDVGGLGLGGSGRQRQ